MKTEKKESQSYTLLKPRKKKKINDITKIKLQIMTVKIFMFWPHGFKF